MMDPIGMCSACWRGYLAIYSLNDDKLVLNKLEINLVKIKESEFNAITGPEINGVKPQLNPHHHLNNTYEDLNFPLNFTGGILLGKDFIQELYVHMGFHPAGSMKRSTNSYFKRVN